MGEAYAQEKRLIRRRLAASRRDLSRTDVARLSAAACERVLGLPAFAAALHVVAYSAIDNELDPAAIAEVSRGDGKTVYYPEVDDGTPGFTRESRPPAAYRGDPIRGPEIAGRLSAEAERVLFLVPGVAFDPRGVRLGRGQGWYDRALASYPAATRVGLAYEFQVVPALPEAPWDVRMHAVVTEARVIGAGSDMPRAQKES